MPLCDSHCFLALVLSFLPLAGVFLTLLVESCCEIDGQQVPSLPQSIQTNTSHLHFLPVILLRKKLLDQGGQTFSVKGQIVNILGFVGVDEKCHLSYQ